MKLTNMIWLFLHYAIARHLPASTNKYTRWTRSIRRFICQHLFKSAGQHFNVEKGASFGTGRELEIGDNSGIGVNCRKAKTRIRP